MIPAVYNANMRITQSPGVVFITYELIHDTRIIPLNSQRPPLSPKIRMYMGDARGRWEGTTLVVDSPTSRPRRAARRRACGSPNDSLASGATPFSIR